MKVARDIFPHDRFDDELYANAVGVYAEQMKSNDDLRQTLMNGVDKVNAEAQARYGKAYADVAAEVDRTRILTDMAKAKDPFFGKLLGALLVRLYNQPALWAKLVYLRSSPQDGAYTNVGFPE